MRSRCEQFGSHKWVSAAHDVGGLDLIGTEKCTRWGCVARRYKPEYITSLRARGATQRPFWMGEQWWDYIRSDEFVNLWMGGKHKRMRDETQV